MVYRCRLEEQVRYQSLETDLLTLWSRRGSKPVPTMASLLKMNRDMRQITSSTLFPIFIRTLSTTIRYQNALDHVHATPLSSTRSGC
jgi:hypothetical protein